MAFPLDKIHFLSYSDDRFGHRGGVFRKNQERLMAAARDMGIPHVHDWNFQRLAATSFFAEHEDYLSAPHRTNGFAWKPFIVLQTLEGMNEGDVLFYNDCGSYDIWCDVQHLAQTCIDYDDMVVAEWGDANKHWSKRDVFVLLDADEPRYYEGVALAATWFFIAKTEATVAFVRRWLSVVMDERAASYDRPSELGADDPEYMETRGDQSIFSVMCHQHGIRTFAGTGNGTCNRHVANFAKSLKWPRPMQRFAHRLRTTTHHVTSVHGGTTWGQELTRVGSLFFFLATGIRMPALVSNRRLARTVNPPLAKFQHGLLGDPR